MTTNHHDDHIQEHNDFIAQNHSPAGSHAEYDGTSPVGYTQEEVYDPNLREENVQSDHDSHVSEGTHESDSHTASSNGATPEPLSGHKDGESVGEWLKNDLEQTKKDLHLGDYKKS